MHTGNDLHGRAIAVGQPPPIQAFHAPGMRITIVSNTNIVIRAKITGHTHWPQQLVTQRLIGNPMNVTQLRQGVTNTTGNGGNKFKQVFGVVGRDGWVRQRFTQFGRMIRRS